MKCALKEQSQQLLIGKYEQIVSIKHEVSQAVSVKEQAAQLWQQLNSLTFPQSFNFNITILKDIFYNIISSNPIEGVFENLSYSQLEILQNKESLVNTLNFPCSFLFPNELIRAIETFNRDHLRSILLSFHFLSKHLVILEQLIYFINLIKQMISREENINLIKMNKVYLIKTKKEMIEMSNVIKKMIGNSLKKEGGYSCLEDGEKSKLNQLSFLSIKWQPVFKLKAFRDEGGALHRNILEITSPMPFTSNGYDFSNLDLKLFQHPRPINTFF